MAIDSKYSSLPWLATGQPDVYETSDLPEVDQAFSTNAYTEDSSNNIDNPSLKVKDATQMFKNKDLTIDQKTDFSDKLCKNTAMQKTGETSADADEEEEGDQHLRSHESVVDRYERIMREIGELKSELAAGGEHLASEDQPITVDQLKELVNALETQITQHKLDQLLGPNAKGLSLNTEASISKELQAQVTRLKSDKKPSAQSAKKHDGESKQSGNVVYELYHSPDVEKTSNLEKLAVLNERLSQMERVVGSNADVSKVSAVTANTAHKGLLEGASKMAQAAALLDGPQLDQLESRLTALTNRLGQMAERREAEMDSETQNRVAALYTLVKKYEKMGDSLPAMVDRLTALKSLHEEAMHFSQGLSHLDSRQQALTLTIRSHCTLLQNMEDGLKQNLEILNGNVDSISDRLKALGK